MLQKHVFLSFPFQVLLFDRSVGPVTQLAVAEVFGIAVFRTGRPGVDPDHARRVFVFRLSDLDDLLDEEGGQSDWANNNDLVLRSLGK